MILVGVVWGEILLKERFIIWLNRTADIDIDVVVDKHELNDVWSSGVTSYLPQCRAPPGRHMVSLGDRGQSSVWKITGRDLGLGQEAGVWMWITLLYCYPETMRWKPSPLSCPRQGVIFIKCTL